MEVIKIETEQITLDQFLKWVNLCESGGQAKIMIQAGNVKVNGEKETRRGRKLQAGDIVEVQGNDSFLVSH